MPPPPPDDNSLTTSERNALALSVWPWCRSRAWHLVRRLDNGNTAMLEDYAQEMFRAVLKAARRWQPQRGLKFITYASRCTQSAVRDIVYARSHSPKLVTNFDKDSHDISLAEIAYAPEESPAYDNQDLLDCVLDKLPPRWREIFRLRVEGLSQRTIAKQVGLSPTRIQQIIDKARNELLGSRKNPADRR